MNILLLLRRATVVFAFGLSAVAAPVIDPVSNASIPAGKSLIIPVTATSPNGRPLTFIARSSTNGITVDMHTNNPFWKMSVVQAAQSNAPGAFQTTFRGGYVTVTNVGDMTFMLLRDVAPHTVDVMQGLTAGGFYTSNTVFHRVIAGFMIQGGDPQTNGIGGPVFRYDDEFHPRAIFSGSGQLALAHPGYPNDKDNNGSQFFVTVAPYRFGDFSYTIFGQLVRGFSVLSCINNTATNASSRPLADVIITRVSLVPDNFDTVLTLLGTNVVGVVGTIEVIADDGAGGRTTNSFQATTVTDAVNDPPLLNVNAVSNLSAVVNCKLTNSLSGWDLEGNVMYYGWKFGDSTTKSNSTVDSFNNTNGAIVIVPSNGYAGPLSYSFAVSPNGGFNPYDSQTYTFSIGDTPIIGYATNFTAYALTSFTNQLVATFTNGVASSSGSNFTALINWGDNSTNSGIILTNAAGWKEVHGSHTYTNAGSYPVGITVQNYLGATANLISTATVPPSVSVMITGTNNIVVWPAWAVDYRLQFTTNLASANWQSVGSFSALIGYDNTLTNSMTDNAMFFRLRR